MHARVTAATLVAAVALLAAGCGGSSDSTTTASTPATTSTAATTTGATTTAAAPAVPAGEIDLTVAGGKIDGDGPVRVTVDKGTAVTLKVRADVSDEVHVHGYDLQGDVAPGKPATIRFTADVPGRFEAELESRGLQILQLTVNP